MTIDVLPIFLIICVPLCANFSSYHANPKSFNRHLLYSTVCVSLYTLFGFLKEFYNDPVAINILTKSSMVFMLMLFPFPVLCIADLSYDLQKLFKTRKTLKITAPMVVYSLSVFAYYILLHPEIEFDKSNYALHFLGLPVIDLLRLFYWSYYSILLCFFVIYSIKKAPTRRMRRLLIAVNGIFITLFLIHIISVPVIKNSGVLNIIFVYELYLMLLVSKIGNKMFFLKRPSYLLFGIFNKTEQGVAVSDRDFDIIYSNNNFNKFIASDMEKKSLNPFKSNKKINLSDIFQSPEDKKNTDELNMEDFYVDFSRTIRVYREGQNLKYFYINNSAGYDKRFQYSGSIILMRDITPYVKDRVELQNSINELKDFLQKNRQRNSELEEVLERETAFFNTKEKMFSISKETDPLTGLLTKDSFDKRLSEFIDNKIIKMGIISIKIHNFKNFTDSKGHRFTNKLVVELSENLKEKLSESDLISRANSDTFYIATSDFLSPKDLENKAIILQEEMKRYRTIDSFEVNVNTVAGISTYPDCGLIAKELTGYAEAAMHRAEEDGKDLMFFTKELQVEIHKDMRLEMEIKEGVKNKEFVPFLQPIVKYTGNSQKIVSYEALVRWYKPDSERPLSPYFFITLAEKRGIVKDITFIVLEYAAKYARELIKSGAEDFKISVNLSADELKDPMFLHKALDILSKYTLDAKYIEFEITERWLIDDINFATHVLSNFRKAGFDVSIDDFGQENSSFNYLKMLPITKLKIDKAYVDGISVDLDNDALSDEERAEKIKNNLIITTLIKLTKSLNIQVLAEGVEEKYQLEFLNDNGCHLIQGYYFYKPMPFEEIMEKKLYSNNGENFKL